MKPRFIAILSLLYLIFNYLKKQLIYYLGGSYFDIYFIRLCLNLDCYYFWTTEKSHVTNSY